MDKSSPALDKIMDIADYLGVSIDDLVGCSKANLDHTNTGRLLILLFNRSLVLDIDREILNFQDSPDNLTNITCKDFFPCDSCDCYFTRYMDGYFLLASTHLMAIFRLDCLPFPIPIQNLSAYTQTLHSSHSFMII